jgi:hypothetical protein
MSADWVRLSVSGRMPRRSHRLVGEQEVAELVAVAVQHRHPQI